MMPGFIRPQSQPKTNIIHLLH